MKRLLFLLFPVLVIGCQSKYGASVPCTISDDGSSLTITCSDGTTTTVARPHDGADGSDGQDGIDGTNGTDGSDGAPGMDGADGQDGQDGVAGRDGTNGQDGEDGADGESCSAESIEGGIVLDCPNSDPIFIPIYQPDNDDDSDDDDDKCVCDKHGRKWHKHSGHRCDRD